MWTNWLRNYNKTLMCPLDKCPFAPSESSQYWLDLNGWTQQRTQQPYLQQTPSLIQYEDHSSDIAYPSSTQPRRKEVNKNLVKTDSSPLPVTPVGIPSPPTHQFTTPSPCPTPSSPWHSGPRCWLYPWPGIPSQSFLISPCWNVTQPLKVYRSWSIFSKTVFHSFTSLCSKLSHYQGCC